MQRSFQFATASIGKVLRIIRSLIQPSQRKKVRGTSLYLRIKRQILRLEAMQKRVSAKAVGDLFEFLERKNPDKYLLDYFLEKSRKETEAVQIIISTAGMAIKLNDEVSALEMLSIALDRFPFEVSAHQQVGVKAFILGKYNLAEKLWTQSNQHREALIVKRGLDKYKTRFLAPSWFLAIGHIAHFDIYFKHKILFGKADHHTCAVIPKGWKQPNQFLFQMWDKYISPVNSEIMKNLTSQDIALLQDEFWTLDFEEGQSRMFSHAGRIIQHRWEAEGRAPLVEFSETDRQRAERTLSQFGL